jgi:hypothetical protein
MWQICLYGLTQFICRLRRCWPWGCQQPDIRDARWMDCCIVTFGRHPRQLYEAILASQAAVAAVQIGLNISPDWAHAGKVLVPITAADCPIQLRINHVVLLAQDVDTFLSDVSHVSYRHRRLIKNKTNGMRPFVYFRVRIDAGHHEP